MVKITFLLFLTSLLLGCSIGPKITEGPVKYNPEYSYAKNILYASGMPLGSVREMKDTVITRKKYQLIKTESTALNGAKNGAITGGAAVALEMYKAVGYVDVGSLLSSGAFHQFIGMGLLKVF